MIWRLSKTWDKMRRSDEGLNSIRELESLSGGDIRGSLDARDIDRTISDSKLTEGWDHSGQIIVRFSMSGIGEFGNLNASNVAISSHIRRQLKSLYTRYRKI